jgi:hypothetical protein
MTQNPVFPEGSANVPFPTAVLLVELNPGKTLGNGFETQ